MLYRIFITRKAERQLQNLPWHFQAAIEERIRLLSEDPRPHGSIKLRGMSDHFRIRQGNYRIVYEIDDDVKIVSIIKIGDRKDVYD